MASIDLPSAGSLRDRVRFEVQVTTSDGAGGSSSAWTPVPNATGLSARITPLLRGTEAFAAMGQQANQLYDIWVRGSQATALLTLAHRAVNERTGQTYNIRFITNPDERARFLLVRSEIGVAETEGTTVPLFVVGSSSSLDFSDANNSVFALLF